jgi:hypothetical protein
MSTVASATMKAPAMLGMVTSTARRPRRKREQGERILSYYIDDAVMGTHRGCRRQACLRLREYCRQVINADCRSTGTCRRRGDSPRLSPIYGNIVNDPVREDDAVEQPDDHRHLHGLIQMPAHSCWVCPASAARCEKGIPEWSSIGSAIVRLTKVG